MSNHHSFAPVSVRRRLGYFTEVADRLSEGKAVPNRSAGRREFLDEFTRSAQLADDDLPGEAPTTAPRSDA